MFAPGAKTSFLAFARDAILSLMPNNSFWFLLMMQFVRLEIIGCVLQFFFDRPIHRTCLLLLSMMEFVRLEVIRCTLWFFSRCLSATRTAGVNVRLSFEAFFQTMSSHAVFQLLLFVRGMHALQQCQ